MKITCDSCGAKYTIADDKVRGRKVKIRCKGCGTPIVVDGAQQAGGGSVAPEEADVPVEAAAPSVAPGAEWSVNLSETDQRTLSTQQLVQGWADGTVTADAYVWKEGMGDWLPILECAELSQLLTAPPAQQPAAQAAAPVAKAAASTRPAAAARVSGGRGQVGTDLFAGVEQAGADFEDVNTSAPMLPNVGARAAGGEDARPTGQRNENSVLFSLDALKAGFSGAGASTGGAAPAGAKGVSAPQRGAGRAAAAASDDPFGLGSASVANIGGGPMFSLADNNALLTAPAPPEPPKPVISFAADPGSAAPAQSSKKGLIFGLIAVVLVGGAGGAYALSAKKEKEEALAAAAAAAASAEKAHEEERKAKAAEERAREEQKAQEAKAAEAAAAAAANSKPEEKAAGGAASTDASKQAATTAAKGTTTTAKKEEKKEEKKEAAPAAGSDQPFSKASAVSALGAAAGSAGSCKKLGGPTGPGKVTVTFANSGRVTTANVTGAPYAGTSVGGCVASLFRKAKVPPFSGSPVTVSKGFSIN
ncbi:MAG TPA: zinc-ribbon domain-containing protein [Polyangiaceae bacterium]|nr:zinc-ribbon domain-containing protein [Polyangiaceae bacterium]